MMPGIPGPLRGRHGKSDGAPAVAAWRLAVERCAGWRGALCEFAASLPTRRRSLGARRAYLGPRDGVKDTQGSKLVHAARNRRLVRQMTRSAHCAPRETPGPALNWRL